MPDASPVVSSPTASTVDAPKVAATAPISDPQVVEAKKIEERKALALQRARRVEAANRAAEVKLKNEREAFAKERSQFSDAANKAKEYDRLASLAKSDPLELLKAAGISQEQVLDRMAAGDKRSPEQIAKAIVDKAFEEKDAKDKADAEAAKKVKEQEQEKAAQAAYAKTLEDLGKLIKAEPDRYEFCADRPDAAKLAFEVMDSYYREAVKAGVGANDAILPFEEVLDTVEADLEAKYDAFLGKSKKIKAKQEAAKAEKEKQDAEAKAKAAASSGAKSGTGKVVYTGKAAPKKLLDAATQETLKTEGQEVKPAKSIPFARSRKALAAQFDELLAKSRES